MTSGSSTRLHLIKTGDPVTYLLDNRDLDPLEDLLRCLNNPSSLQRKEGCMTTRFINYLLSFDE